MRKQNSSLTTADLILAADAPIDLQMHTTYSDGDWTPEQLLDYLVNEHFALVAITDHDRVDTAITLQKLARQKQLPLLVAAEMSTSWRNEPTDLLCYGFDPQNQALQALVQDVLHRQQAVTQQTYINLLQRGYTFPHQAEILEKHSGEPRDANDLVTILVQHGHVVDEDAAAEIVLDAGYFFATNDITLVVEVVHHSGGVCLLAHPGRGEGLIRYDAALLDKLRQEVPIDGLEAYYPAHTPEQATMYLAYAQKHNLLVSSGSDSHRPTHPPIKYPAELSRGLLARLGIQIK